MLALSFTVVSTEPERPAILMEVPAPCPPVDNSVSGGVSIIQEDASTVCEGFWVAGHGVLMAREVNANKGDSEICKECSSKAAGSE